VHVAYHAAKWCSYGAAVIGPKLMLRRRGHARQLSMCAAFCTLSMIVDLEVESVCWVVLRLWHAKVWQCMLGCGNVC